MRERAPRPETDSAGYRRVQGLIEDAIKESPVQKFPTLPSMRPYTLREGRVLASDYGMYGVEVEERRSYLRIFGKEFLTGTKLAISYSIVGYRPNAPSDYSAYPREAVWGIGITPDLPEPVLEAIAGLFDGTVQPDDTVFESFKYDRNEN